jgi:hypothetical protein
MDGTGVSKRTMKSLGSIALAIVLASGCAKSYYYHREPTYEGKVARGAFLQNLRLGSELEDRILSLDPERITERDIEEVLARAPAPRLILIHGTGLPVLFVAMQSFSQFLIGMGYPENKIRNPRDGSLSYSSFKSSSEMAGIIAWYYEREGMPVNLLGYSSGGIQAVKVLHELAGTFGDKVAVWNPLTEESERRHSILDPLSGQERPVVGVHVGYAMSVAAGGLIRLLPNQWSMLWRLRTIPDSVEHFTGATVGMDLVGGDFFGLVGFTNQYGANGAASVRNVQLPASYVHGWVFNTDHLVKDPKIRDWINAYQPSERPQLNVDFEARSNNILLAADIWYSIKKQWCLEAQRLVRAKRAISNGRG